MVAGLANGLRPVDIGRLVITNESPAFPSSPAMFLQPAYGEFVTRVSRLPRLALQAVGDYLRSPLSRSVAEVLDPLTSVLPNGIFDSAPIEE